MAGREERLARVRQGICDTIAPHDLRIDRDQDCLGEVRSLDLGVVRIACGSGRLDGEVIRTPRLIRVSDPELCKIDIQLHGRAVVGQDDCQAELTQGAFTFVDLSRPSLLAGELGGVAAVMFPRSMLPVRYRDTKQLAGVVFQPGDANAALVGALIEERLADPGLSPTGIADAHHISLRYLYRIFEAQQSTVSSWIRSRRLYHCRQDLADPALLARPVSAVGARWGFADATHFARVFKAEFGVTPTEYRRLCTDGPGPGTHRRDIVVIAPSL